MSLKSVRTIIAFNINRYRILLLIGLVVTFAVTAFSTTMDDDSAATDVGSGPLDGVVFVGKLCPE